MIVHDSYTYAEATDLLRWIDRPSTVVDLGAGQRATPVSRQVSAIQCDTLTSVDVHAPSITILQRIPVRAKVHVMREGDVASIDVEGDVALLLDVLEHLEKATASVMLARLKANSKEIVVFLPLGDTIGYSGDVTNPYQRHRSAWHAEELESLGFIVEVYKGFHTHVKHEPVDAAWAVWTRT